MTITNKLTTTMTMTMIMTMIMTMTITNKFSPDGYLIPVNRYTSCTEENPRQNKYQTCIQVSIVTSAV